MNDFMIPVYVKLVKEGRRSIEQVPQEIRTQVQAMLDEEVTN